MGKAENTLTKQILKYLEVKGYSAWRNNNIAIKGRKFIGRKGVSDIICLLPKKTAWIEVKDMGKGQSKEQIKFQADAERHGHIYILAYSLQDVMKII